MVRLRAPFVRLHRWLLPRHDYVGWTPYVWLIYLAFFVVPAFGGSGTASDWWLTIAGVLVFLPLYFRGYWTRGRETLAIMAGLVILGAALLPWNPGAAVFFIYAGAFSANVGSPRSGARALAAVVVVLVAACLGFGIPKSFFWPVVVIAPLVGLVNIYYAELGRKRAALEVSEEERRRLAVTAERERIARDLHDLLGHTLSVIALKSELASRLLERSPERAAKEIREVEQISREALSQVRAAVTGYRTSSVAIELANARQALEAADVRCEAAGGLSTLPPDIDATLAMILREAVTNVVRHAKAGRCRIGVEAVGDSVVLRVFDDGRGGPFREHSGLAGMRERVGARGGSLEIRTGPGTEIIVMIPLDAAAAAAMLAPEERTA